MITLATSFLTKGAIRVTVGKATENANSQAFSQIRIISFTSPILKIVITSDIIQDIIKAIKNEKT